MDVVCAKAGLGAEFVAALEECDACIAGSAALYAMRHTFGVVNTWEPNDIDVWMPCQDRDEWIALSAMRGVLERSGFLYKKYSHFGNQSYSYAAIHHIARIFTFTHPARAVSVQIIIVRGFTPTGVAGRFDMSVCKVVWTPELGFGLTKEDVVHDVRNSRAVLSRGELYNLQTQHEVAAKIERTRVRIRKYASRGFTIVGEREAILPVEVMWKLAKWNRRDHAFFPDDFKAGVRALVLCACVRGVVPLFALDAIISHVWMLECIPL